MAVLRILHVLAAAAALAGVASCSTEPLPKDPPIRTTGLPSARELVCIQSSDVPDVLQITMRRLLADRGLRVRMLAQNEECRSCRYGLTLRSGALRSSGDLPASVSLEFKDFYTGEAQRATWEKPDMVKPAQGLVPYPYADPDQVVENLVDVLFPAPIR